MPPRPARRAVGLLFLVNGVVIGSWVPHIPAVKAAHALGDAALGSVLLAMAVGSVVALPMAGWLVATAGSRRVASLAALALCAALPLPVVSSNVAVLAMALVVLGAANATLDVSMNAQAALVEIAYGRPIMSSFHALYSVGGLAGAALAGAAMAAGATDVGHVTTTAAATTAAVLAALPWLVPSASSAPPGAGGFRLPPRGLALLGALAFCGLLAEGAMGDWTAVYLHDTLGTTAALASAGFAAMSLAMAAGRAVGDRVVLAAGRETVLRASALLATLGLGGALVLGRPLPAIAGFALVGLGIANVVPVLFGAAARVRGLPEGVGLAAVASCGYLGFLAGPPLIGVVAGHTGLTFGLGVVVAACGAIVAGGGVVRAPADGAATRPSPSRRPDAAAAAAAARSGSCSPRAARS